MTYSLFCNVTALFNGLCEVDLAVCKFILRFARWFRDVFWTVESELNPLEPGRCQGLLPSGTLPFDRNNREELAQLSEFDFRWWVFRLRDLPVSSNRSRD